MVKLEQERLIIVVPDAAPAELHACLISALAAHLRHYAANPHKRREDAEHAVVLTDLLAALAETE